MLDKKQKRYDLAYLRMAQTWGELSHCKRKKVGALIVKDKMRKNGMPISHKKFK